MNIFSIFVIATFFTAFVAGLPTAQKNGVASSEKQEVPEPTEKECKKPKNLSLKDDKDLDLKCKKKELNSQFSANTTKIEDFEKAKTFFKNIVEINSEIKIEDKQESFDNFFEIYKNNLTDLNKKNYGLSEDGKPAAKADEFEELNILMAIFQISQTDNENCVKAKNEIIECGNRNFPSPVCKSAKEIMEEDQKNLKTLGIDDVKITEICKLFISLESSAPVPLSTDPKDGNQAAQGKVNLNSSPFADDDDEVHKAQNQQV